VEEDSIEDRSEGAPCKPDPLAEIPMELVFNADKWDISLATALKGSVALTLTPITPVSLISMKTTPTQACSKKRNQRTV
jgi:hypothetical protein